VLADVAPQFTRETDIVTIITITAAATGMVVTAVERKNLISFCTVKIASA